jgi:hypothetical protein
MTNNKNKLNSKKLIKTKKLNRRIESFVKVTEVYFSNSIFNSKISKIALWK